MKMRIFVKEQIYEGGDICKRVRLNKNLRTKILKSSRAMQKIFNVGNF